MVDNSITLDLRETRKKLHDNPATNPQRKRLSEILFPKSLYISMFSASNACKLVPGTRLELVRGLSLKGF